MLIVIGYNKPNMSIYSKVQRYIDGTDLGPGQSLSFGPYDMGPYDIDHMISTIWYEPYCSRSWNGFSVINCYDEIN